MTIADLIDRTVVKMHEVSPFEAPNSLTILDGVNAEALHPVRKYIKDELPSAAEYCMTTLPIRLLSKDIESTTHDDVDTNDGVARVPFDCSSTYPIRVKATGWRRDVTAFFYSSDQLYLLQQNSTTRSKEYKPAVAIVPEDHVLELYSWRNKNVVDEVVVYYIDAKKPIEGILGEKQGILSPIEDYIAIRCAEQVFGIMQNASGVEAMKKVFNEKLQSEK